MPELTHTNKQSIREKNISGGVLGSHVTGCGGAIVKVNLNKDPVALHITRVGVL
jgi:hypothetical protein